MIAIPFLFFLFLLCLIWMRNKRIDVPFVIVSIYATMALFSILVEAFNCRPKQAFFYDITFVSTFVYCFLFFICVFPLIIYSDQSKKIFKPVLRENVLKISSVIFFCFFVFFLIMSMSLILDVLTGDMNQIRMLVYAKKNEFWTVNLPDVLKLPALMFSSLSLNSWIFLFLSFFSLTVQKIGVQYVIFFFLSSLYAPLLGVLGADRSAATYWIISFIVMFVYFVPSMSDKEKKIFLRIGSLAFVGIVIYISAMTSSRFADSHYGDLSGSSGGVVTYLGQSFIYFTFFFDNLHLPETEARMSVVFPFLCKMFGGETESIIEIQDYLSDRVGLSLGVFYSFFGHIMVIAGKKVMFTYCYIISLLSFILLQKRTKFALQYVSVMESYMFMLFSSIIFLGLFANYYAFSGRTLSIFFWGLLLYFANRK